MPDHTGAGTTAVGRQSFVVVFDFDHTLVDCNTDTVVPAFLGRGDEQRKMINSKELQWTKLMDTLVAPFSEEELTHAVHQSVVVDPDMPSVFEFLHRMQVAHGGSGADLVPGFVEVSIASDANLLFIEATLDGLLPQARSCVSQIHSNPYYDLSGAVPDGPHAPPGSTSMTEDEKQRDAAYNAARAERKSRVCWYEPCGHPCAACAAKPNMCKSLIVHRVLSTTRLIDPTVIFVGDGANDYCPVLNVLRPRDYIFARDGFPLHQLLASTDDDAAGGCCGVGLWSNAKDLLQLFRGVMDNSAVRLPVLTRLRDVSAKEFRSVTLSVRMPDIVERTIADNAAHLSKTGRAALTALISSLRENGPVPPLPGQVLLPMWLRNYAFTAEYDTYSQSPSERPTVTSPSDAVQVMAPRWGQLPWLQGEIYFYHLLWQYVMMRDEAMAPLAPDDDGMVNRIDEYMIVNPLYSQACALAETPGMVSPAVIQNQASDPWHVLMTDPLRTEAGILVEVRQQTSSADAVKTVVPYRAVAMVPHHGLLPSRDRAFFPYRDIFAAEKESVLSIFIDQRVVPMLACQPWDAPPAYAAVLLRWMLWGNGIDLSMFTLEQLGHRHQAAINGDAVETQGVEKLRAVEAAVATAQDTHILGNELDGVVRRLQDIIAANTSPSADANGAATLPNRIDVVMDNVGVECISDLCFGLWFLTQSGVKAPHQPTVVYHTKPQPYYVSDVTPRDIDITMDILDAHAQQHPALAAVITPFTQRVKEAFSTGRFCVDADTVWTQPSEYRGLPPRVINRYFYQQRVRPVGSDGDASELLSKKPTSGSEAFRANKCAIIPRTSLVIFKGDLNYRRVIGDRHWNRTDSFTSLLPPSESSTETAASIQRELLLDTNPDMHYDAPSFQDVVSAYWPTHAVPVCSIRTIKCENCVGVPGSRKVELDGGAEGSAWRISGKYGVILYAS